MKGHLLKLRDQLTDSFWFLPSAMALLAVGLALGMVALDRELGSDWVSGYGWVFGGGADGARSVLSAISGSVMTVVSIVFSLTISTLAQTSSHYGPRVLRNFTSDRRVQLTLGTFIATFVYCLLVLRTVRSVQESTFVPYLAVTLGLVLALASMAVLIFFIHFIAQSIQAENLIAEVGQDFERAVPQFFPAGVGESHGHRKTLAPGHWQGARQVDAPGSGYLQRVDDDTLLRLATDHDLQCRLEKTPGQFVSQGTPLLHVLPAEALSDELAAQLQECFLLGAHRTRHQDPLYSIQQLVEIAAHALSPGINEPFTALTCIDWLGASIRKVMRRELPASERYDEAGGLRVVAPEMTFEHLWRTAFDQVRVYGADSPDILLALLNLMGGLAPDLRRPGEREFLEQYVEVIRADAESQIKNAADARRVTAQADEALRLLRMNGP